MRLPRSPIARWGSTEAERLATWPGDELTPHPRFVWTNAVTVRRAAADVWPWVTQLGQGRGASTATTGWRTPSAAACTAPTGS